MQDGDETKFVTDIVRGHFLSWTSAQTNPIPAPALALALTPNPLGGLRSVRGGRTAPQGVLVAFFQRHPGGRKDSFH